MNERQLRVVDGDAVYDLSRGPESVPERARRLMLEAKILACEEVDMLRHTLAESVRRAESVRDGGEIFPIGVREQARQLTETLPNVIQTLQALSDRHLREVTGEPIPPIWKGSAEPPAS